MGRIGGRPTVDYRRLAAGDVSDLSLGVGEESSVAGCCWHLRCGSVWDDNSPGEDALHALPLPRLPADALGTDFRALYAELLSYGGYRPASLRRVAPAQLTPEWLQQSGGFRPVLVPAAPGATSDMGLALPEGPLTVDRLASKVGLPFEVRQRRRGRAARGLEPRKAWLCPQSWRLPLGRCWHDVPCRGWAEASSANAHSAGPRIRAAARGRSSGIVCRP